MSKPTPTRFRFHDPAAKRENETPLFPGMQYFVQERPEYYVAEHQSGDIWTFGPDGEPFRVFATRTRAVGSAAIEVRNDAKADGVDVSSAHTLEWAFALAIARHYGLDAVLPMAAVQATGRDDASTPNRFPDPLWPLVERFLLSHFHARSGFAGHRYKSPSQQVAERAAAGSIYSKACGACGGRGYYYHGTDRSKMCDRCHGAGQTLSEPMVLQATAPCPRCHGARVYHPRRYRWPGIRPDELACCVPCRGAGFAFYDGGQNPAPPPHAPVFEQSKRSWLDEPLRELDRTDPRSALALDLVYGSVGYDLTRHEGEDRTLAVWLLTKWGKAVVACAKRRQRNDLDTLVLEMVDQRNYPNDLRAARLRRAEDGARLLLANSRKALFAADRATGHRMLRAARRLYERGTR